MSSVNDSEEQKPHGEQIEDNSSETSDSSTAAVKYYRRTREEAIACKRTVPLYKMFDMDTGLMKEKYRRMRSPSPPINTRVYEVGTGRAFSFKGDMSLRRIPIDSALMAETRRAAFRAGVWEPPVGFVGRLSPPACTGSWRDSPTQPGTSGLRRVIPVPASLPPTDDLTHGAEQIRRAREKVLGWRTSTPEPLESIPSTSTYEEAKMCRCVSLVSSAPIDLDMRAPDLAEFDDRQLAENNELKQLLDASPTLRYLRKGYLNFVEADVLKDVQRLVAYSCRAPCFKLYKKYKSMTCRPLQPRLAVLNPRGGTGDSSDQHSGPVLSPHYRAMIIINQYLKIFSLLCDFNYKWVSMGGLDDLCNAIVVDKQFTYNHIRKCHVPYYRLLNGDGFTDLFVEHVKKCENRGIRLKHVRFVSTMNTLLYTNGLSLARRTTGRSSTHHRSPEPLTKKRDTDSESKVLLHDVAETNAPADASNLPLKKRCLHKPLERAPAEEVESTELHDEVSTRRRLPYSTSKAAGNTAFRLSTENWPYIKHRASCSRRGDKTNTSTTTRIDAFDTRETLDAVRQSHGATDSTEAGGAKNPTLIVFKYTLDEREMDTLVCHIIVEIHLGDKVLY